MSRSVEDVELREMLTTLLFIFAPCTRLVAYIVLLFILFYFIFMFVCDLIPILNDLSSRT